MVAKTKVILAVIGLLLAIFGGGSAYTMYIDNSTNIDNSQTVTDNSQSITIHEGDIFITEVIEEIIDEEALFDLGFDYFCEEVDPESELCDDYWDEWD